MPPRLIACGLFLAVVLGAHLRLGAALHTQVDHPLRADAGQYFRYAYNLRHHGVYARALAEDASQRPTPDALCSPGYPIVLLAFAADAPTDRTILDIVLMQAALGILMIPLVYWIGCALLTREWALLPALLVALSPRLIISGTYVLSETLFTFLLLLALAGLIKQFRQPERTGLAVLGGCLVGMAAITRPTVQYLLPALWIFMLPLMPASLRWRQAGGLLLGFALALGPWILRNLLTLGVASDPSLSIYTLVHGHYPDLMFQGRPETLGYPYRYDPRLARISASMPAAIAEIVRGFRSEPLTSLVWYLVGKPLTFLGWNDATAWNGIFTYPVLDSPYFRNPLFIATLGLMWVSHWIWVGLSVGALALLAVPAVYRRLQSPIRSALQLLACVFIYFLAVHIAGFPLARYGIPLLPLIYLMATFALAWITGCIFRRGRSARLRRGVIAS